MSTTPPAVRYSQSKTAMGAAKDFPWEYPIPVNAFWDDLRFTTGSCFFRCFTEAERAALPIDPDSAAPVSDKLALLLRLLQAKLAAASAAAAPRPLHEADHALWDSLQLAVLEMQLQQPGSEAAAEATARLRVEHRGGGGDSSNLSAAHALAALLVDRGQYAEAEATEAPVRDWLDGRLGSDSPQALGSRRIIARAVWGQGRRDEARALFGEIRELIEKMGEGRFAVYQEEEREILDEAMGKLE